MHKYKNILRWILVVPSGVFGWYVAFFGSILLVNFTDYFCSPNYLVSGNCVAPWKSQVLEMLIIFGAGLSAVLVILFCVLMAPSHRNSVGKLSFGIGFVTAFLFAYTSDAWGAFWSASLSGLLCLVFVLRYIEKMHNKSLSLTR